MCYFTRITLTVILLCCFQCRSQDFGGSDGDTNSDGATRRLCEWNCCLDDRSWVCIASMCICVILLESLSQFVLFCYFQGFSQEFGSSDAMVTAMAQLVGFVSLIVARMITHRYV